MNLWSEYENPLIYIIEHSSDASRYEILAEEAVELAHAAQKMARYLRGEQPVADDFDPDKTKENLIEEYADISLAFDSTIGMDASILIKWNDIYDAKATRWVERLKEKEAGHEHD